MAAGSTFDWYSAPGTGGAGGVAYVGVYGRTDHYYQASYQGAAMGMGAACGGCYLSSKFSKSFTLYRVWGL